MKLPDTFTSDRLELKTGSGAALFIDVAVSTLEASVSEGGILDIAGDAERQYVSASTGGEYLGKDLDAAHTEVRANTGGEATIVAKTYLSATANTGGTIIYKGNPEEKYTKTSLAGEIRAY